MIAPPLPLRSFTYLFNRQGVEALADRVGSELDCIWGRRLQALRPGDDVYLVAVENGLLQLIARFRVERLVPAEARVLGRSTPISIDRRLPAEAAAALRFVAGNQAAAPVMWRGRLDPQTVRGVRQLTPESAAMLDRWMNALPIAAMTARSAPMRALSVRQPWAELILRGIKTIEVRSRPTQIRERVYLYGSPIHAEARIELAIERQHGIVASTLPRGVLVGTVEVVDCAPLNRTDSRNACFTIEQTKGFFGWRLANPKRCEPPIKPLHRAQPVWFSPF